MSQSKSVVSVGILLKEDKILLGLRPLQAIGGNTLWEFPGGSVELGEQPQETLIRELKEELSIQVKESKLGLVLCDYTKKPPRWIVFFYVRAWEGEIKKNYHQELKWLSPSECREKKIPNINPQLFEKIMKAINEGINYSSENYEGNQ